MGHHHNHSHHDESTKNISVAFFLNLFFTLIEFIGGIYTNSLAITSDAIHDLGDSLSLGMAWYFQKKSNKQATETYSYGFKRFSILGAIINSTVLLMGSILIIYKAIPRIIHPENSDAKGMMWFAILGIIVNGIAILKLKKGTSLNERVVTLHLLEDVLGWFAVLIASIVMQFWEIQILDPILSILIAIFILYNVFKNGKESIKIILQATPKDISIKKIEKKVLNFSDVQKIYNARLWSLDGKQHVFTSLLLINKQLNEYEINTLKNDIRKVLHDNFNIEETTLEIEKITEDYD